MTEGIAFASDLWIDQPDAGETIERRRTRGELSAEWASRLRGFADEGYMVFTLDLGERAEEVLDDVDRFWRERPVDLAYACDSPARSMVFADARSERRPGSRLHDIHSHSRAARALYLDAEVHRAVRLVTGEEPVAIQSLLFEYGSEQTLHRDPVVVRTDPPSHLMAAWIALEDIAADSGPLCYVPGSHRLPYFAFAPGRHLYDAGVDTAQKVEEALAFQRRQCEERGLGELRFTARRGEVLLWHAGLLHGGDPVTGKGVTRKSFVVHFSTRAHYRQRGITVNVPAHGGREEARFFSTETLVETEGCRGFENPLLGFRV